MKKELIQYIIGGVLAVGIDIGLLSLFFDILNQSILVSSIIAFICSSIFGYLYHRNFSFKNKSDKKHTIQLGQFIIVNITTQIVYTVLLFVGVEIIHIHYLIVASVGKGGIFLLNYLLHKLFTFRNNKKNLGFGIGLLIITGILGGCLIWTSHARSNKSNNIQQTVFQMNSNAIPSSFEGMTWYQIIPDRFDNGNPKNDYITVPLDWLQFDQNIINNYTSEKHNRTGDWNSLLSGEVGIFKELIKNNATPTQAQAYINRFRRYGGDFAGIRNRIDYLKDLGIKGVFFNPVWIANSAMRYDVLDYRHIDPRLSDNDPATGIQKIYDSGREWTASDIDFHNLVNELQQNGIKVMIDLAFTYSAARSFFFEDIARKGKASEYYDWFELFYEGDPYYNEKTCKLSYFRSGSEYKEATKIRLNGRRGHCPKVYVNRSFNGSIHPNLEARYKAIIARWMQPQTINGKQYNGVDAIRLDAAFELPIELRKSIYEYVKSIKPEGVVIGEEWSNNFIFIGYKEFDGLTNYFSRTLSELFFIGKANPALTGNAFNTLIQDEYSNENRKNRHYTLNQIGSHDTDRIFSKLIYTNRTLNARYNSKANLKVIKQIGHHLRDSPDINKVEFGAKYIETPPSPSDYTLRKTIAMLQFMLPGAPNIYYGDEIGMRGSDDPHNRKPMLRDNYIYEQETTCEKTSTGECADIPTQSIVTINKELHTLYKTLIHLRKQSKALQLGSITTDIGLDKTTDDGIFAIGREYEGEKVYFISNQSVSYQPISVTIKTNQKNKTRVDPISQKQYTTNNKGNIPLTIQPEDSIILVSIP